MPQIFPKWTNRAAKIAPFVLIGVVSFVVFVFWYWFSPLSLDVGYRPKQPIPFSHKLHAGDLKIDCMFCHFQGEKSPHAGVPPSQTCMNCHEHQANKNSLKLAGLITSWNTKEPPPWKRVHKVPDFAYFDHSRHINAGVSCKSCHGRVDQMEVVRQEKALSMSWCLDCHRHPAPFLVPVAQVANMEYHQTESFRKMAEERAKTLHAPVENCSGCHR